MSSSPAERKGGHMVRYRAGASWGVLGFCTKQHNKCILSLLRFASREAGREITNRESRGGWDVLALMFRCCGFPQSQKRHGKIVRCSHSALTFPSLLELDMTRGRFGRPGFGSATSDDIVTRGVCGALRVRGVA